jgi:serine/threonine protein kinase
MVEALKYAHEKMICHCDVRPPNLIIVPPAAVMANIASFDGDIGERAYIAKIDVNTIGCLLNDWGMSVTFSKNTQTFQQDKKKDLLSLVSALAFPEYLITGSNVSSSSGGLAHTIVPAEGRSRLDTDVVERLHVLGTNLKYDDLSEALSNLTYSRVSLLGAG